MRSQIKPLLKGDSASFKNYDLFKEKFKSLIDILFCKKVSDGNCKQCFDLLSSCDDKFKGVNLAQKNDKQEDGKKDEDSTVSIVKKVIESTYFLFNLFLKKELEYFPIPFSGYPSVPTFGLNAGRAFYNVRWLNDNFGESITLSDTVKAIDNIAYAYEYLSYKELPKQEKNNLANFIFNTSNIQCQVAQGRFGQYISNDQEVNTAIESNIDKYIKPIFNAVFGRDLTLEEKKAARNDVFNFYGSKAIEIWNKKEAIRLEQEAKAKENAEKKKTGWSFW